MGFARRWRGGILLALTAAVLGGCAVDAGPAFRDVAGVVRERTGERVRWNRGTVEDREAGAAVRGMLGHAITPEVAVRIALLNNPGLQAVFEEIGISQADLVQAGLLQNPSFAASWRFPDRAPGQTDAEYAISGDFLDFLVIPLRKKVAAAALERTKASVAQRVVALAGDVKESCYRVEAGEQLLAALEQIAQVNQAAAELAEKQQAAGTINDLDLANAESVYGEAQLDVAREKMELAAEREKLNRLLGLSGGNTGWKMAGALPAIPQREVSVDRLESIAIDERLDFAAKRISVETLGRGVGLSENFQYLAALKMGVDTEHNTDGQNVTGPTLALELPIFDQGKARIAKLTGEYRRARRELLQMAVDIKSEVRAAHDRMLAERDVAMLYQKTLLPQRARIIKLTQLHYNGMLKGTYDLLLARQNEFATERGSIEALRDYWVARTELERAVGGRLPEAAAATGPAQAASPPATQPGAMDPHMHMNGDGK